MKNLNEQITYLQREKLLKKFSKDKKPFEAAKPQIDNFHYFRRLQEEYFLLQTLYNYITLLFKTNTLFCLLLQ